MKGSAVPIWICVIVLAISSYGGLKFWRANQPAESISTTPISNENHPQAPKLTEFTLTERSGKEFHSRSLDGEVWVASVFFSACPSVCLELNKALAELQQEVRFSDVKFVSISCDPRNDTPGVLTAYAQRFAADKRRWLFCTGDLPYIERVARDMLQIAVQGVTHSERAVIFDRSGKFRGAFIIANPRFAADRLNFERTLLECLAEPRPAAPATNDATAPLDAASPIEEPLESAPVSKPVDDSPTALKEHP